MKDKQSFQVVVKGDKKIKPLEIGFLVSKYLNVKAYVREVKK